MIRRHRAWLCQAVIVRRVHVFVAALIVGVLSGSGLVVGAIALDDLSTVREARLQDALRGQLTASEVKAISKRTARLEAPTDAEIVDQITARLRICLAQGGCKQTIRTTLTKVLDYADVQQGPPGPRGEPGRNAIGRPGPMGPPGRNGRAGRDARPAEIVRTPAPADPQTELNARLLQDLDELVRALDGRVDRLSVSLRCILDRPLDLLRC